VYKRHCLACHGAGGWGDGPDAKALKVAPANFHRFLSFLKSDEELLRTIEHGVVFSPMHSWRGQLTDGEMQDVVAYIRLLAQQGR
jgi:mono/diheme cytochrome c family protein